MRKLPTQTSVTFETVGDEVVAYDARLGQAHMLDAQQSAVWAACDGRVTVDAAAKTLRMAPEQVVASAEALIVAGLAEHPTIDRRSLLQRSALAGGAVVASGTVLSMLLPAASAAASTVGGPVGGTGGATVGDSSFTPDYSEGPYLLVEKLPRYRLPAGQVVSWSTRAYSGSAALVILRPTGAPNTYTCVYSSAVQTLPAGSSLTTYTLPSPVAVQAGDYVGSWADASAVIYHYTGDPADQYDLGYDSAPPAAGSTVTPVYTEGQAFINNISVTLA